MKISSRNNAKNALAYLKNLLRSHKKEFLDQREDTADMPANGMIFMTQNNEKYGFIDKSLIFDYQAP